MEPARGSFSSKPAAAIRFKIRRENPPHFLAWAMIGFRRQSSRWALRCGQIEHVIVSHLHFDHAGGLTRRAVEGETSDWTPPVAGRGLKLTFPNAPITVPAARMGGCAGQSIRHDAHLFARSFIIRSASA